MNIINEQEYVAEVHTLFKKYVGIRSIPGSIGHKVFPTIVWIFFADANPSGMKEFRSLEIVEVPIESAHVVGNILHDDQIVDISAVSLSELYSQAELMWRLRSTRDEKLKLCDSHIIRNITQIALETETTLTVEQYSGLLTYMQELRELPETCADLTNIVWPTKPSFV